MPIIPTTVQKPTRDAKVSPALGKCPKDKGGTRRRGNPRGCPPSPSQSAREREQAKRCSQGMPGRGGAGKHPPNPLARCEGGI